MYEVICFFTDLKDNNHPYNVGDIFPREGMIVTQDRLIELSTSKNRRKKPLIILKKDKDTEKTVFHSKTEINRMPIAELRRLAEKESISGFEEKTGVELKKLLIKKYGL